MKQDIIELKNKFNRIKNKGWIKSQRMGTTGIGYTFENLIMKSEENLPIPDYKSIEIKTMRYFSKRKIHLFNATPDGDFLFPIKRVLKILGYPDKNNPEFKVLNISVNTKEYTNIGYYKKVKLIVNHKEEKIELKAINNNLDDLNIHTSWSFSLLEEKLNTKLKYLSLFKAYSKTINSEEYFYYNQINFFKLKGFEDFIYLLENGYINITFKIGVFKSGNRLGQIHDRGTDFSISEDDINKLYTFIE